MKVILMMEMDILMVLTGTHMRDILTMGTVTTVTPTMEMVTTTTDIPMMEMDIPMTEMGTATHTTTNKKNSPWGTVPTMVIPTTDTNTDLYEPPSNTNRMCQIR